MRESDCETDKANAQSGECIDHERREAVMRLAKYTAPAMLAVLMSAAEARAQIMVSVISDNRLKRDIAHVGKVDDHIDLYRYRYLWSDTVYVGVMAQEVAEVVPEAVERGDDGYLRVDYARLGLRLQTWDEFVAAQ